MELKWERDAGILVRIDGDTAVISADRSGLLSLAEQLRTLAGEVSGSHIHYDEYNSLQEGSAQLIIEKISAAGEEGEKA